MHSFIFNLLSLVKKALSQKPKLRPSGLARGHQMSTKGQRSAQTGTNWADIQTSTPVFLLSTQRIRQTVLLTFFTH